MPGWGAVGRGGHRKRDPNATGMRARCLDGLGEVHRLATVATVRGRHGRAIVRTRTILLP